MELPMMMSLGVWTWRFRGASPLWQPFRLDVGRYAVSLDGCHFASGRKAIFK